MIVVLSLSICLMRLSYGKRRKNAQENFNLLDNFVEANVVSGSNTKFMQGEPSNDEHRPEAGKKGFMVRNDTSQWLGQGVLVQYSINHTHTTENCMTVIKKTMLTISVLLSLRLHLVAIFIGAVAVARLH